MCLGKVQVLAFVLLAQVTASESGGSGGKLTVVVFGDSTTAPRGDLPIYGGLLARDLPQRGIAVEVVNAGVPNSATSDACVRLERDVLAHRPALVVMQFGINDSWVYVPRGKSKPEIDLPRFEQNLKELVARIRAARAQVVLMTPNPLCWTDFYRADYATTPSRSTPFDGRILDGFNVLLRDYAVAVRTVAAKESVPLVDIYAAFERQGVKELLLDGVHPNTRGHRLIANLLVEAIVPLLSK